MNDKINLQDLIDLLEKQVNMEQVDVAAFVRAFWETIEEGLLNDGIVKVKGLGTFKLVGVESRESINVNTGERFEIQQHSKITFMADSSMRNIINKPFAHFESVILNEKTTFEDIEESVVGGTETENEDDETVDKQVEPVNDVNEPMVSDSGACECVGSAHVERIVPDTAVEDRFQMEREENSDSAKTEHPMEDVKPADSIEESQVGKIVEDHSIIEDGTAKVEKDLLPVDDEVQERAEDVTPCQETIIMETESEPEELSVTEDTSDTDVKSSLEELIPEEQASKEDQVEISVPTGITAEEPIPVTSISEEETVETPSKEDAVNVMGKKTESATEGSDKLQKMDIYRQPSHHVDEKGSHSPLTGRKLLFIVIIIAFVFVAIVNLVSWFRMNKEEEDVNNKESFSMIHHEEPEVEDKTELTLVDSISKQETFDVNQIKVQQREYKQDEQKVTPRPVPKKEVWNHQTEAKALVTHVKAKETVADTLEYDMVGVLAHDTIRPGDTLAKFSFKYYGNRRLWQYIVAYNKAVVRNPNNVPIGTVLAIPKLEQRK